MKFGRPCCSKFVDREYRKNTKRTGPAVSRVTALARVLFWEEGTKLRRTTERGILPKGVHPFICRLRKLELVQVAFFPIFLILGPVKMYRSRETYRT